jgi:protein SCO1
MLARVSSSRRTPSARFQQLASRLADKPVIWLSFVVAMFTWPILRSIRAERFLPRDRPVLAAVRPFTLRDQNGDELGPAELRGRIWVASFNAVECKARCAEAERTMKAMAQVRHRTRNLGDAIRLVTFMVDPEHTTAEQMSELSATHRANHGAWRFVSGAPARMGDVLHDFQVVAADLQSRVALVDGNLQIRGYYDLADESALGRLLRDVSLLVSRGN